jgi:ATP-binding cassette subfamily B protein
LDGLSFKLERGRHYAFVGKNGAGKTTVTKLLTGLYTEYEGGIYVNGKELRTFAAGALKAMFSVVYQDFAKYYISLKDNVALGDAAGMGAAGMSAAGMGAAGMSAAGMGAAGGDAASGSAASGGAFGMGVYARVPEAIRQAGLDGTVAELPGGADTPLGKIKENGHEISGGEWQRVAMARSLISRAPVKILDEPTAALDPIGESRVYGEFEKLMRGKTTIFISHKLGSTKLADEILVIDGGRVIERGTHD